MNENSLNKKLTTIENSVAEMRTKLNLSETASLEEIIEETAVKPYPFKSAIKFYSETTLTDMQPEIEGFDFINRKNADSLVSGCTKLQRIDFSKNNCQNIVSIGSIFSNCSSLKFIDMRTFNLSKVSYSTNAFTGVPTDCLIIVKDTADKNWMASKFASWTNVKTVAEYEEELANE